MGAFTCRKVSWVLLIVVCWGSSATASDGVEARLEQLEKNYQRLSDQLKTQQQKNQQLASRLKRIHEKMARTDANQSSAQAWRASMESHYANLDAYFSKASAVLEDHRAPRATGTILDRTKVGGYFDMSFFSTGRGSNHSNFDQQRFVTSISSQVNDRVSVYAEVEFEGGSDQSGPETIMPTQGNSFDNRGGGGATEVEQAYADFRLTDWLTASGGAMLVPMGRLNQLHDSDIREFVVRPLPDRLVVPTTWTETGFGVKGVVTRDQVPQLPDGGSVNFQAYIFNGLRAGDGRKDSKAEDMAEVAATIGDKGLRDARPGFRDDNNSNKAFAGRVGFDYRPVANDNLAAHLAGGSQVGVSYYVSALDDAQRIWLDMVGVDLRTSFGDFFEKTLGLGPGPNGTARVEFFSEIFHVAIRGGNDGPGGVPEGLYGWYGEGHYRFMPNFIKNLLPEDMRDTAVLMALMRYNAVDLDTGVASSGDRKRLEFGFNFRPYPNVVIKTEYQINNSSSGADFANNQLIAGVAVGF